MGVRVVRVFLEGLEMWVKMIGCRVQFLVGAGGGCSKFVNESMEVNAGGY